MKEILDHNKDVCVDIFIFVKEYPFFENKSKQVCIFLQKKYEWTIVKKENVYFYEKNTIGAITKILHTYISLFVKEIL